MDPEINDPNDLNVSGDQQSGDKGNLGETTDTGKVRIGDVEIALDDLRKSEQLRDYFDAYDNRKKWQAENTQRSQELSESRRKVEILDRLMTDPRFQKVLNPESAEDDPVSEIRSQFPDVDPRFLNVLGKWFDRVAQKHSMQSVTPLLERQGDEFERNFLKTHPDVQPGTQEYRKIASMIRAGAEAEDAYNVVFPSKMVDAAIKQRDEETKRKLRESRTSSRTGAQVKSKNFSERAMAIINDMYGK